MVAETIEVDSSADRSRDWCGRGDSNPYDIATASPSSWCVCQFRHFRVDGPSIQYIGISRMLETRTARIDLDATGVVVVRIRTGARHPLTDASDNLPTAIARRGPSQDRACRECRARSRPP